MENVKTKKKVWPLAVAITALVLVAAAVLCWIFWPRPLVTAQALVAADLETAPIYNEEGAQDGRWFAAAPSPMWWRKRTMSGPVWSVW